ncbi:hypothetical protein CDAR_307641 [Caerostris darwini]|uniref:Uncharacterized protein n=1 Tax=Caerostris darwini TaxID=1538125 RepID=A0AAV4VGJ2_9ARAC|nr:hypothetical protein CDAR_307641 [Caerostris darwini]
MSNGDPLLPCYRVLITIISRLCGSRYFPSPSNPRAVPGRTLQEWKGDIGLVIFSSANCCIISSRCWSFRGEALFLLSAEAAEFFHSSHSLMALSTQIGQGWTLALRGQLPQVRGS